PVDVVVSGGTIARIGRDVSPAGEAAILDGGGGALTPGLHDHHIHVYATAAARRSVAVGPDVARSADELAGVLRAAAASLPPEAWLRAVGYHESPAGELDRDRLDALLPGRAV